MDVFPFAVFEFANFPGLIQPPHFPGAGHVAIVFAVSVDLAGTFHRFHQVYRLLHGLAGEHFAEDMQALFQAANGKGRVLVGIIGQYHRVHGVLDEGIKIVIPGDGRIVQLILLALQRLGIFVADGHYPGPAGLFTVIDHAGAAIGAQNADANLFHKIFLFSLIKVGEREIRRRLKKSCFVLRKL